MKFRLKNITSRRAFLIYVIVSILITVSAVYILSNLITDLTEKANDDASLRTLVKKQEFMSEEFSKFLEQEKKIQHVLEISSPANLQNNLQLMSLLQANNRLVENNWFQINENPIQYGKKVISNETKNDLKTFLLQNKNAKHISVVVRQGKELVWRIFFKLVSNDNTVVKYGYDINLGLLHTYFSKIDKTASNYAFVFDKKGTCVYHPEAAFIGKNIFKISSFVSSDTIFKKNEDFAKRITMSEFLKLDVIRYTQKLDVKNSNWFICVNFPKIFVDENVAVIKRYSTLTYSITTIMLLLIFYLFSYANRRAYREKGIVIKEKNKLLVENEKIIKEKALIQLQQLKEQINPHFLFNSLNSLYMLIGSDIKVAQKFTLNLSRIYRYLIDPPEKNIVPLKDELLFIEKYIFLQQTRFKEELFFSIEIENEAALNKHIPYLAFQIVVENAIKHNRATQESPLTTKILIKEDQVIISNTLQKKLTAEPSTKFGLNYLKSIYNYYSKTEFKTSEKDGYFVCILPLISIHS
ncbi:sensor histidine kinase [Flavobacterium tistrianum]|uniref:sensor histidine kinase n=1 Tax=Flavobacterium tistrianum TaxID=1685414 RepID=UPI000DAB4A3C|nr:sensor histidine kinase [Flavobacterium tistrianum]KAF2340907.1 sensor histidine kinase [Flavobacterium tistrianum]